MQTSVTDGYLMFVEKVRGILLLKFGRIWGILFVVQSKHVSESTVFGLRGVFECCVHRTLHRKYDRYSFSEYAVVSTNG